MEDERLIEEVYKYKFIYEKSDAKHSNKDYIGKAWADIAKELNCNGTKLEDGKGIGGAGRLTDTKTDTLQNYYGFAIRQNKGNLEGMTAAVKAVLPHVAATADNPSHQMCPNTPDTWCGYRKDPQKYKHTNGLP
ncbi:hypothetical protein RRG08_043260 [Elysia crispata]|uniref:Mutator-like transposase domain-containing protein n=1 Tax=Elysia crispata TaxID=231223 RepID=A0AAE1CP70_9GAST|nr:hypothetical protein RRG08_043260 [Elysia crispata]